MRKRLAMGLILTLILAFSLNSVVLANNLGSDQATSTSIHKAISYLQAIQNKDGGFPGKAGGASSIGTSCWVIMALGAAQEDISSNAWAPGGMTPIQYLNNCDISFESTNDYARLLLALTAAKQSPVFQHTNLADMIVNFQQTDGHFCQPLLEETEFINSHLWSILALSSAGYEIPNQALAKKWLLEQQNEDGGFGWVQGIASDSDDTGIAIQTLVVLGEDPQNSPAIKQAINYLKNCQESDGGFNSGNDWMSNGANASSSSWALQGLIAAGENTFNNEWIKGGHHPQSYLLSLQSKDGYYQWKSDLTSLPATITAQTLMALLQKPFPVNIDYRSKNKSLTEKEKQFSDLPGQYWAYQAITDLVQAGILSGYPDGTFKPEKKVSRAEFTRYLVAGLGLQELKTGKAHSFSDVSPSHWAYNSISITANNGIVTGMPDGTFNPDGEISGAELATLLFKTSPTKNMMAIQQGPFWYSGYVEYAKQNGLLYPNFQPASPASRAQCAYSIVQLRNLINKN